MLNEIISIDLLYFKILSFLKDKESVFLSEVNKGLYKTCQHFGYFFNITFIKQHKIRLIQKHIRTIRKCCLHNFYNYPLFFYPNRIKLENTLMNLNIEKKHLNVTDISYEHHQKININFNNFPNIKKLHIKYKQQDRFLNKNLVNLQHITHLSLYHIHNVSHFASYISKLPFLEEFYTNFHIGHLNIQSKKIKVLITHGINDTFTVSKNSNLDVCSNGYGLCMSSKMLNNGKLSNNLDEHIHKHLLPKYNWYIVNIFTKIYSHETNNFIGTNNIEVDTDHSNSITFNFKENDIDNYQQNVYINDFLNEESYTYSEIDYDTYSSSEEEEDEEDEEENKSQILSISNNYKKRRLNIWKEIYSY